MGVRVSGPARGVTAGGMAAVGVAALVLGVAAPASAGHGSPTAPALDEPPCDVIMSAQASFWQRFLWRRAPVSRSEADRDWTVFTSPLRDGGRTFTTFVSANTADPWSGRITGHTYRVVDGRVVSHRSGTRTGRLATQPLYVPSYTTGSARGVRPWSCGYATG